MKLAIAKARDEIIVRRRYREDRAGRAGGLDGVQRRQRLHGKEGETLLPLAHELFSVVAKRDWRECPFLSGVVPVARLARAKPAV